MPPLVRAIGMLAIVLLAVCPQALGPELQRARAKSALTRPRAVPESESAKDS